MALYPHTVTLYNATGEDTEGHATYRRTVLEGVHVERRSGAVASLDGNQGTDGLALYVPGTMPGYVDPRSFAATGWTLRAGDVVALGVCTLTVPSSTMLDVKAAAETYVITGVERFDAPRSTRVHHFEVAAS